MKLFHQCYLYFNKTIARKKTKDNSLVKVCAWCPEDNYPVIESWQKFTHGICRYHFYKLNLKRKRRISLFIYWAFVHFINNVYFHDKEKSFSAHLAIRKIKEIFNYIGVWLYISLLPVLLDHLPLLIFFYS